MLDERASSLSALAVVVAALVGWTAAAQATPTFLGNHRDWNVYAFNDNGERLCYIASEPTQEEGNYSRRGSPAFLVAHLPGPSPVDEVSVQPGYNYQADSEVEVVINGNDTFRLFTQGGHAWAKTTEDDEAMIEAMKAGLEMTVRGTSTLGTYSLDTYSLLGFTAAYEAMYQACAE